MNLENSLMSGMSFEDVELKFTAKVQHEITNLFADIIRLNNDTVENTTLETSRNGNPNIWGRYRLVVEFVGATGNYTVQGVLNISYGLDGTVGFYKEIQQ